MAIQHVDIADPDIHEPKGVSAASAETVYVADGAGTGAWEKITLDQMDPTTLYAAIQADLDDGDMAVTGRFFISGVIADISTSSSVIIPIIQSCTVIGASVVLGGAITTADAAISFKNAAAASMGTDITVEFTSSAKGDQYAFTATGNNVLVGPTWIEVATDGASDTAMPLYFTVELEYIANASL